MNYKVLLNLRKCENQIENAKRAMKVFIMSFHFLKHQMNFFLDMDLMYLKFNFKMIFWVLKAIRIPILLFFKLKIETARITTIIVLILLEKYILPIESCQMK